MSLFQCDTCGCVENTATSGTYHVRNVERLMPKKFLGMKLCCVCGPDVWADGSNISKTGKWHDLFTRKFYPVGTLYTDAQGNVRNIKTNEHPKKEDEVIYDPCKTSTIEIQKKEEGQ